jgi:hypothetical protein
MIPLLSALIRDNGMLFLSYSFDDIVLLCYHDFFLSSVELQRTEIYSALNKMTMY